MDIKKLVGKYVYRLDRDAQEWSEPIYATEEEAIAAARELNDTLTKLGGILCEKGNLDEWSEDKIKKCERVEIGCVEEFIPEFSLEAVLDEIWDIGEYTGICWDGAGWKDAVLKANAQDGAEDGLEFIFLKWLEKRNLMPDCYRVEHVGWFYFDDYVMRCCKTCGFYDSASGECRNEEASMFAEEVDADGDCELYVISDDVLFEDDDFDTEYPYGDLDD